MPDLRELDEDLAPERLLGGQGLVARDRLEEKARSLAVVAARRDVEHDQVDELSVLLRELVAVQADDGLLKER